MADIRSTPVANRPAYYLAGLLDAANEAVSKPFGYENDPVRGLTNLLGIPAVVKTLENVAYGMPNTGGTGMATQLRPEAKEAVGVLAPMAPGAGRVAVKGAVAAGKYAAPKVGQIAEQYAVKTGLLNPMIAYHGSPYAFDKFDLAHVGKGEGAQAYGHGMYFAESPEIAKQYRNNLSTVDTLINGKKIAADDPLYEAAVNVAKYGYDDAMRFASQDINNKFLTDTGKQNAARLVDQIKSLKGQKVTELQGGAVYKVDIPDPAVATFMDWDKRLGQQPAVVKAAIKKTKSMLPPNALDDLGGDLSLLYGNDVTPAQFLNTLESLTGSTGFGESALNQLGVKGIRYLDGVSRPDGAGTSNFVVFDPSIVKILERNGQPMGLLEEAAK